MEVEKKQKSSVRRRANEIKALRCKDLIVVIENPATLRLTGGPSALSESVLWDAVQRLALGHLFKCAFPRNSDIIGLIDVIPEFHA